MNILKLKTYFFERCHRNIKNIAGFSIDLSDELWERKS